MEKQLSYFPVIPLKEMALRRIAVVLVNKPDFLATAEKFPFMYAPNYYQNEWFKTVSSKITDSASKLLLPVTLTSEMISILRAVGSEILRWRMFHRWFVSDINRDFSAHVAKKLYWTTLGMVDYRKTSEILVRSALIDKVQRFALACFYCLEDYIPILWEELSEEDKRKFYNNEDPLEVDAPNLQLLLPYILQKNPSFKDVSLAEVRLNSLKYAALSGNKTATEYCIRKLPKVNIDSSLFNTALCVILNGRTSEVLAEKLFDVLCYLLSLMSPERQLRVFKELPRHVLVCFFACPWQELFLDIADVIWALIPENKYGILTLMLRKHLIKTGYYLPNIVQKFFLGSPRNYREEFANFKSFQSLLFTHFFHAEDSQTIQVVFRSLDAADRVRLVFCEDILRLFDEFLLKDSWHLVEVCVREASLSKEDRVRLGKAFAKLVRRTDGGITFKWKTNKRKRFFRILNKMDASIGTKRSAEDETITRVKKVCNNENSTLSRN